MKNKHLALLMAFIMCFSFIFGAAAATEGEQVIPSTSAISPTQEKDFIDELPEKIPDDLKSTISDIGSDIIGGAEEAHGFLATMQKIIDTIKVLLSNFINTIFPFFNIGMDDSLFR